MKWLRIVALVSLAAALGACKKDKEGEVSAPRAEPTPPVEPTTTVVPVVPDRPAEPTPPPPEPADTAQICAGQNHTCVMQATGKVLCTGRGLDGELGDGMAQDRFNFVPVVGIENADELACGYHHTCVRHETGEVSCWGRSYNGELGNGATDASHVPVKVTGLTGVTQLDAGDGFTCARAESGKVICWGSADDGRLGNGATTGTSATPAEVQGLADARQIGVGRAHACAIKASGELVCWGANQRGQLAQGDETTTSSATPVEVAGLTGVKLVDGGGDHTCAWTDAGLRCWGSVHYGQLGNGVRERDKFAGTPQAVNGDLADVEQLALGPDRSCVLLASGEARCWGENNGSGNLLQVGSEEVTVLAPTPMRLAAAPAQLALSDNHSCALLTGGRLLCWGYEEHGQLGIRTSAGTSSYGGWVGTPTTVSENVAELVVAESVRPEFVPDPVAAITVAPHLAVGGKHVCGVTGDGKVLCFGGNFEGQLGIGSTQPRASSAALPVVGLTDATQVSAGGNHTCARRADGSVACWGSLVGTSSSLPVPVASLADVAEVVVGGSADLFFACARKTDGTVWCWGGNNSWNECADGRSVECLDMPSQVPRVERAVQLAIGDETTCARLEDGTVMSWGFGNNGAIGFARDSDDFSSYFWPGKISHLTNVTHVAGHGTNFCAVSGGKALCWGDNHNGQIGNGRAGDLELASFPTAVAGVGNVALIDTGWGTTCAVQRNGKAMCWGDNEFGQTGHNASTPEIVTRPWAVLNERDETVAGFGGYVTIDCGSNFCCGLHVDGHVSCMGATPIEGANDLFDESVLRSDFPVAAPGIQFPPQASVTAE
jgi:alpha-tubulin suppressor-like RCC1 family protein